MTWPLRNQILLPFALAILAALGVVTVVNAWLAASHTTQQIETQLRGVARTLQESSFPLNDTVLQQTRGLSGAEFLVTDSEHRVVAGTRPGATDFVGPAALSANERAGESSVEFQGERYFHLSVQRPPQGESGPLTVHVLYPEAIWQEARFQAAWPPIVVGLVALGVVAILSFSIANQIADPVRQVTSQVERIAKGDLQFMTLPETDDEIRQLVASVNQLVGELNSLTDAVKRSERLATLGQLSGGLAHHLRNSVTGAQLALQIHQRHGCNGDPETLSVALRQLQLTAQYLQKFLAVGQPRPLRKVPCDLEELIAEVVELLGPACLHRGVRLTHEPHSGQPKLIAVDADQLRQGIVNLVMNGIEAAGAEGAVRVELKYEADSAALRVLDTGSGPPAKILGKLFEPFASSKPDGVGLGLAVTKQIVEAHGGRVTYSRQGNYTCFEIRLPAQDCAQETPSEATSSQAHSSAASLAVASRTEHKE